MVRFVFDEELRTLHKEVTEMGEMIEKAILNSISAVMNNDADMAKRTIENDMAVNQKEREIETLCLRILMTQQPVASDLRRVSSALKIITDMERIGDQASDICEISLTMNSKEFVGKKEILSMGKKCADMVIRVVNAYVQENVEIAKEIIAYDDAIDTSFMECKQSVINNIRTSKEDSEVELDVFMIAKYFERIGDHATNIAEWIIYSNTGRHVNE